MACNPFPPAWEKGLKILEKYLLGESETFILVIVGDCIIKRG